MKTKTPAQKPEKLTTKARVGRPRRTSVPASETAGTAGKTSPENESKAPRPDLQPNDWVRAGMKILAQSGVDMVLIPPLAKALGVTKGSFYWHFSSRDELLMKLIEEWRQHATLRVIDIVERAGVTAQEKIRLIAFIGSNSPIDEFGGAVELAVRNWARVNPTVRKVVADVDRQRLNYLTQLYQEVGSTVDPELLACLHYCFSSGLRLLFAYPEKQKLALRQAALEQIFFAGTPAVNEEKSGS